MGVCFFWCVGFVLFFFKMLCLYKLFWAWSVPQGAAGALMQSWAFAMEICKGAGGGASKGGSGGCWRFLEATA